jgi:hypothetical protein
MSDQSLQQLLVTNFGLLPSGYTGSQGIAGTQGVAGFVGSAGSSLKITNIQVTDSSYTVLDDTAVDTAGGYIKITGSGFTGDSTIIIGSAIATSSTYVSPTEYLAQVPAQTAGSYIVYIVASTGETAIRPLGLAYSATPVWVTATALPNAFSDIAYSFQLDATGATAYALAAGSSLPTGLTLSSSGLISGTTTVGSSTDFNFTINAIDAELQDSPKAFTLAVALNVPGQQAYTTPGTYSWTAPANVISVSVVCVGGGGGGGFDSSSLNNNNNNTSGGGGGGLGWRNNISVTPGQSYTVVVGAGGSASSYTNGSNSTATFGSVVIQGGGGTTGSTQATLYRTTAPPGGTFIGDGGGSGGSGGFGGSTVPAVYSGGGGAGGYSGNGGAGGRLNTLSGSNGAGGGGGGGGANASTNNGRGGGGVGLLGQGSNGTGGTGSTSNTPTDGGGGSGGAPGNFNGGLYGGGSGSGNSGGGGAVRIIWGSGRAFPSTNTGNQ